MGGDDLGSDDDYVVAPLKSTAGNVDGASFRSSSSDDDEGFPMEGASMFEKHEEVSEERRSVAGKKRQRSLNDSDKKANDDTTTPEKKSKKDRRGGEPLRVLGTRVRQESVESQAELLSQYANVKFLPQHIAQPINSSHSNNAKDSENFMDRLLTFISKKQLKKTTTRTSPRALILCLSARRCVAVLKDLVPLRLRAAKLFPKQGTVEDQAKQLENSEFGVAVGTPHRVKELMERGSLSLKDTLLLGLDTYENDKSFSVYTLADTSPHTQDVLKNYVHPHCTSKNRKKGSDVLKVAFV